MSQQREIARLQALQDYGILDTNPEERFDRLTHLAADLFDAPIALISLVDAERQWFKSRHGLEAQSTPRSMAFCAHALPLSAGSCLVVEDATSDPRFKENPLVTGDPNIRFYAGAVLNGTDGHNLGTLCVIDTKTRPTPSTADLRRLTVLAGIVVDELELRRAMRVAEERQHLLEMAERMSGVGHWKYQVSDGRVMWSDEVYRIHGVTRQNFDPNLGSALAFYHEDDQPKLEAILAESLRTGKGYEFGLRINRADGEIRNVVAKAECMMDDTGTVSSVHGVFQDVTAHRSALKSLEQGKARYKLLTDNVGDVITRIRLDGSSSYISPSIHALLGLRPEEMTGRPAHAFVYGPDQALILDVFREMAGGADDRSVEHRAQHKDGRPIWVETHFKLVRDNNGAPLEMVAAIRDIGARKALEAELRQAQADAESASAVKGEFLANMSHELRTPLTSIIGFTGLAAEQADLSDLSRTYIGRVRDASRALLCTVNDILDFSKLEAGQVNIAPEPVALAKLSRATLDLFTPQAGAKDLTLTMDGDAMDDDIVVVVDPDRIRQILLNFVSNAVKFTAAGGVTLRTAYDNAAGLLTVEVIDTGEGIPQEKQDRLFKRFSQIDGSLTRVQGGTGLGLAICKGLVEAMGGEIGMDSRMGQGSRFWFRIPAPRATLAEDAGEISAPERPTFAGVRVLVADDHPANRELARLFLSGIGAEVSEAADGEEAVKMAAEQPFDVILMDLRMPRLDGLGALRRIRAIDGPNDAIPILAFTADAGSELAGDLHALGFQDIVAKPLQPEALILAVARATTYAVGSQAFADAG